MLLFLVPAHESIWRSNRMTAWERGLKNFARKPLRAMVLRNAKPDFIEWELTGRQHPAASSVKRMTPPDEIAIAPSYLLGPESAFVNGSDLLTDRGVIAARAAAGDAVQRRALSAFGRQGFNLVSKPSRPQENRQENH